MNEDAAGGPPASTPTGTAESPGPATPTDRIVAGIRRVNRILHYVAGFVLLALMLVTVANIIGRAFFRTPLRGTVELTEMAMILIVYLGLAHAEHESDHISVDLLYEKVGSAAKLALTVLNGVVGLVVIGLLAWNLYRYAGVLDTGGYVTSILRIPQAPVAIVGVVGSALFVLALATTAVVGIRALRNERV